MPDGKSRPRPRRAIGPERQRYFDGGDVDRVMAIVLALASELASMRERLDTHERLGLADIIATPELVDAHIASPEAETAREAWRDAYIRRIFRVIDEDREALAAGSGPEA